MNMMNSSRRGSALLIVLGMLAFMVMSSVGFAIFMRQSRVPSSHLRRESTARYLLKSALANAMKRIDGTFNTEFQRVEGVYDDPYPGILPEGYNAGTENALNGDYWVKRVFTPFGLVNPKTTVSTLTLEALAYLPPAIINEARVYSRQTRTAQWEKLSYDLGRYAFTAIDVSDCFDLNKLASETPRRSSAPDGRIALASLVKDGEELAKKVKNLTNNGDRPLVSIADFNVAMGKSRFTPFSKYIPGGGSFYTATDASSLSNALFITDTWFPARDRYLDEQLKLQQIDPGSGSSQTTFDLSKEKDQPWKKSDFKSSTGYLTIPESRQLFKILDHNLGVGVAALYDYLDADQIPVSLCLPTVEATPMVAGLSLAGDFGLKFSEQNAPDFSGQWSIGAGDDMTTVNRDVKGVVFNGLASKVIVQGTLVYPFKRAKTEDREKKSFTVEACVATYFGEDEMTTRPRNGAFRPTEAEWRSGSSVVRDGIVFTFGKQSAVTIDDVKTTKAAADNSKMKINIPINPSNASGGIIAYHVTEKAQTQGENFDPEMLDVNVYTRDMPSGTDQNGLFRAFAKDGSVVAELKNKGPKVLANCEQRQANPGGTKQSAVGELQGSYKPYIAVWVRVVDKSGKTVDLVPASVNDDVEILKADLAGAESQIENLAGAGFPLLNFTWKMDESKTKLTIDDKLTSKFSSIGDFDAGWKRLFCIDPRYNWAPEDWFGDNETDASGSKWLTAIKAEDSNGPIFGKQGRDRDLFMFTSDQEYLQSIGELSFLPYVHALGKQGTTSARITNDFTGKGRYAGGWNFAARKPESLDSFANGKFFWRTYSGYFKEGWNQGNANPFTDLRLGGAEISVSSGEGGFRVNPLSPDSRAIAAAVYDTPWDYIIASTNDDCNAVIDSVEGKPENYAFGKSAKISEDRWSEDVVGEIAAELSREVRAAAARAAKNKPGEDFDLSAVFEDIDWEGGLIADQQDELFNDVTLDHPLHGVDRKFLYSFWRDCFQNRQQLFLIFLRAEPLTVGGAGGDSLASSQLGARGVALVWRDPAPPIGTSQGSKGPSSVKRKARSAITAPSAWTSQVKTEPPHRMRVLFYHQFD